MKQWWQTVLLLLACAAAVPAVPGAFRSYATVLDVQPIVETSYEPVSRSVCSDPDRAGRKHTEVSSTIGADIQGQIRLWQTQRACTTVTEKRARDRVTAYRVTYRYRGYTATTRLSYHPGERIPVNVRLSPLP